MTWFNSIYDLQYYHPIKGVPCYCEQLIYASDLLLQASFYPSANSFNITFYVYSADGITEYEEITAKFDYYVAQNSLNGQYFFNARLKEWAESMCEHQCFIIRAVVVNDSGVIVFDKYTERYCQSTCCDEPRDIVFSQDGIVIPNNEPPTPVQNSQKYTNCGDPLIRLISYHDCYDPFADVFYGTPSIVVQGTPDFPFVYISTFRGRIVPRPTEIEREISYNCRPQRVTSARQYLLEGFEYFPPWKMLEIQAQMSAKNIFVDDYSTYKEYVFAGGAPLQQINSCFELFKLNATLQDCEIRKVYGCDDNCGTPYLYSGYQSFFIVPADYQGGGFYDDNKILVAESVEGLIEYIRGLNWITATGEISLSPVDCDFTAIIGFSWAIGQSSPVNSIYYDDTSVSHRIYALSLEDTEAICGNIPTVICEMPEFTISVEDSYCAIPEFTIETEYTEPEEIFITDINDWEQNTAETEGSINNRQVLFTFVTSSDKYIPDGEVGEAYFMTRELIGIMSANGRPIAPVMLSPDNSNMAEDTYLEIDENGQIFYTGEPTDYNVGTGIRIQLENLVYNTQ